MIILIVITINDNYYNKTINDNNIKMKSIF